MNELALNYLQERGITPETIAENKIEICARVLPSTYRLRLRFDQWWNGPFNEVIQESIWFPCMDEHGTTHSWVVRPFPVLPSTNGSGQVKFITPKGDERGYPFIPQATWKVKDKSNHPLLITEGPCKALAALQACAFPIAVGGVWMATNNNGGTTQLHRVLLDNFTFRGRTVYIAFDADFATNPSVRQALIRTCILVRKTGAEVKLLTWAPDEGKGLDDYLAKASNSSQSCAEALESLCAKAGTLEDAIRECDLEFVELELTRARLKPTMLAQLCKTLAPGLKVPVTTLKETVQAQYDEKQEEVAMAVADPWPEEVDGAALADELVTIIKRHVIVFDRQVHAAALWIILTYLEDVLDCLPLLAIQSPVKRCGKTIFLSLLSRLVCKPLQTSNTSTAALYRVIERFRPTLLIDEVDAWLKDNEEARGILNSGHTRDLAFVLRCNAESNEPERFSTWAPKVLAGIGEMADTLVDRSILVKLERRKPTQQITKLRDANPEQFVQIRQKLVRWALDNRDDIREARPTIPNTLNDREGDNWFPLLAIADQLAGDWPTRASVTALALSDSDSVESVTTLLLARIKEILDELPDDQGHFIDQRRFVPSLYLIQELNRDGSEILSKVVYGKKAHPLLITVKQLVLVVPLRR